MQIRHPEMLFEFELADGWQWHPDAQGGGAVAPARQGVLYVSAHEVVDRTELPNLSRMLAGFLTLHVRPVAADELVRARFPGAQGFAWQYREELEGRPERHAWRVWVAGNEGAWAFLSYNGPETREAEVRQDVDAMVASFRLRSP